MTAEVLPLSPIDFPLSGSHLIEASAGTGKTYTIAALYLRLVLGHGEELAFGQGRPLTPPEILVVTFTEAATQELRDRIRSRLTQAAGYFRSSPEDEDTADDVLSELRASYPAEQWPACAHKLQLAAEWMDEAAVSTIHGWCNRMLKEHAFDSQSLFNQTLETDPGELFAEVVRDYWRSHYYPLNAADILLIRGLWPHPDKLQAAVKPLIEHAQQLPDPAAPAQYLANYRDDKRAKLAELKQPWATWSLELQDLLDQAREQKAFNGTKLKSNNYTNWLGAIHGWAEDPTAEQLSLSDAAWQRLSLEGLAEIWKTDTPPNHPALAASSQLRAALAELPQPDDVLLSHAVRWIAENFATAQQRRAQMGFDDLLTNLAAALDGEHGPRLAEVIRQQFPVALIDEFQDTDPVQYNIFDRIYQIKENRPDCGLILIGDPKQAIYAFRGADIYTYLQARQAVKSRLYTLDKNFRSSSAMVAAANRCFDYQENQADGSGAFLFRREQGNPLPFLPVQAQGRAESLVFEDQFEDQAPPALTLALLSEESCNKGVYLTEMAAICASRIVAWLNQGQNRQAGFLDLQGQLKPLQPGDVAVLVNNAKEASHIRQALSLRGVRSVYLSDRESVFASPQAVELQRWLTACAEPDNDRWLRAALSTPTLGLSFAELDALNHDESAWESRVLQFKAYREIWQRQGVLPMLRRLLFEFGCVERLLQSPVDASGSSGERRLTDLLHLSELLQQASYRLEGEHALIRFLAEQLAAPANDSDAQKIRLESDADLVKVVTIHKSKGLEYPLVFLPFICATRMVKAKDKPLKWHDANNELQIALQTDEQSLALADQERLGEDVRKLYVALTRARYATWLGLAAMDDAAASAIGHLLGTGPLAAGQWQEQLQSFAADQAAIAIETAPEAGGQVFRPAAAGTISGLARRLQRPAREAWWIASYSGLRTEQAAADTPQAENLQEALQEVALPTAQQTTPHEPMHRFYKGAEAGTFLHDLMEWAAQLGFQQVLADPAKLRDGIARRCRTRQWQAWVDPLTDWLSALLQTPLPISDEADPASLRLADLSIYQVEMEFWFEAHWLDLAALDQAVCQHTLDGRPRPKLAAEKVNGLMKGFMDLVFEYEGKYYVADYKSNWLGPEHASYSRDAISQAILDHRYDLQYALYLFALHRLLQSRLADYDYERHIGGALYIFMRGIEAETAGVHFERPAKGLIEQMEGLFSK